MIKLDFNMIWVREIFKDLLRRTSSEKVIRDKAFNIAKNLKHDEYQCRIALIVYKFFRKNSGSGVKIKNYVEPTIISRITQFTY